LQLNSVVLCRRGRESRPCPKLRSVGIIGMEYVFTPVAARDVPEPGTLGLLTLGLVKGRLRQPLTD
jgi:PEP-CTERM motif